MAAKKHTAAYKLFHYPYFFMVPENELWDENDTEYFGRETTGNAEWDRKLASAPAQRYLFPAEAAELAARGVRVELLDPKDAVTIYQFICQHLHDWLAHLEHSKLLGRRNVPLDGLKELNSFARYLGKVGRRHGLIEKEDPYRKSRARRSHQLAHRREFDLKDFEHSDAVMNRIVELSKHKRS